MHAMRYEHLIQINDPQLPLLTPLSPPQLWNALVLRAENPLQFMPTLEAFHIQRRDRAADGSQTLHRRLDFGSFAVQDQVTLTPPHRLLMQTQPGPTWPASRLKIDIEVPQPELLFLRFIYESDEQIGGELDALAHQLRGQAYEAADLDMVVRIRQLAEQGVLGS